MDSYKISQELFSKPFIGFRSLRRKILTCFSDTLPPYMTRSEMFNELASSNEGSGDELTTAVPDELAEAYLRLPGASGQSFTFTRANSFIQIDNIPTFQLRSALFHIIYCPLLYIREKEPPRWKFHFGHKTRRAYLVAVNCAAAPPRRLCLLNLATAVRHKNFIGTVIIGVLLVAS